MNDRDDVEAILDQFRDWFEAARLEADDRRRVRQARLIARAELPPDEVGLIDLVEEFTALRHEVKLQTKSGRGLFEQTETMLAALKQAIEQFRSVEPKEAQAVWTAGKALAEALADLDEALDRGGREIERARQRIAEESLARAGRRARRAPSPAQSGSAAGCCAAFTQQVMDVVADSGSEQHDLFDAFLEGYGLIQKRLAG